jgi:hypothetical protein
MLFNFAFAEDHMFARTWIIFFQLKFFRLRPWIFFGHVKVAGVGCAYELDLKGRWLGHDKYSLMQCDAYLPVKRPVTEKDGRNLR